MASYRAFLSVLMVALMLVTGACGAGDENATGEAAQSGDASKPLAGKTVWYLDVLNANPILNAWAQAINVPIAEAGGTLVRTYSLNQAGELDIGTQAQAFDRAIAAKPAAIVYFVLDPKSQKPQIERARQAGIPVFAMFGRPEGIEVNAYVTGENFEQGQVIGKALADALPGGAEVTVIAGLPTPNTEEELDGVMDSFEAAGLEFVGSRDEQRNLTDIASGGQKIMQGLIQKYPNLDGVVAFNDDTGLGAIAAIKGAGKSDQIKVVSRNGSTPAIEAIKKGDLLATCDIDPITVGKTLGEAVVAHVSGTDELENEELKGPAADGCLVDASNVRDYVPWEDRIPYAELEEK